MKITKVCCQGCGANLELGEELRFVTCNFCGSRLEIIHDATTTHSKLLEEIDQKTDQMAGDLRVIRLQNDLEKLDREWAILREGFMTTNKDGSRSEPSSVGSAIGGVIAIVMGIGWMILTGSANAPAIFPLFGLVFIGAGLFGMFKGTSRASDYGSAQTLMQQRRTKLISEIDGAKRSGSSQES